MLADGLGPSGEVGEGVAVGRQDHRDIGAERRHLVERVEELRERVAPSETADVRGDRRQHVVTRHHHALCRVEQAEVVLGVAGRVHGDPLAVAERQGLGVLDAHRRPGDAGESGHDPGQHVPRPQARRHLHRLATPRRRIERAAASDERRFVAGRGVGGRILGVEVARVETVPEHLEATVGDDVGTGLAAHVRRHRRSGPGASGSPPRCARGASGCRRCAAERRSPGAWRGRAAPGRPA